MNRPEIYKKSIDILVKAFFKGELRHMSCQACAVGNLVRGNMPSLSKAVLFWSEVHCYDPDRGVSRLNPVQINQHYRRGLEEIAATGYTPEETSRIEYAFEKVTIDVLDLDINTLDFQLAGLLSVVDMLQEIHEVRDEEQHQKDRKQFLKVYDTLNEAICV